MNMQTIHLNISSDIFDKVISFLELLPKIDIVQSNKPKKSQQKKESLVYFFQASPLVGLYFKRNSEVYQSRLEF